MDNINDIHPCPFSSDGHRFQSAFGIEFHPDELWLFCERCAVTVRIQRYEMLEGRRPRPVTHVPDEIHLDSPVAPVPDPNLAQAAEPSDFADLPF